MPRRSRTTPEEIIDRMVQRLRTVEPLNDVRKVFVAESPLDVFAVPGEIFCSVWPEAIVPDAGAVEGGSPKHGMVVATRLWTSIKLDTMGQDEKIVLDASRGLLPLSTLVFKSLWLHDLADGDDNQLLTQLLRTADVAPPAKETDIWSSIDLGWAAEFMWDEVAG